MGAAVASRRRLAQRAAGSRAGPTVTRDAWGVAQEPGLGGGGDPRHQLGAPRRRTSTPATQNFTQISPRSWWAQLRARVHVRRQPVQDQPVHPPLERRDVLQLGPQQRLRLLGVRRSSRSGGAFFWECCGETHPMSFNDMISTGIGGHRGRRADVPAVVAAPGQPGHRARAASSARSAAFLDRPRARLQPRSSPGAWGPQSRQPDGAPRLAPGGAAHASSSSPACASSAKGESHQREHEDLRLHRPRPHLRQPLRQRAPQALRLPRRRLPVQRRREEAPDRAAASAATSPPGGSGDQRRTTPWPSSSTSTTTTTRPTSSASRPSGPASSRATGSPRSWACACAGRNGCPSWPR